jgi:hypothetical protein
MSRNKVMKTGLHTVGTVRRWFFGEILFFSCLHCPKEPPASHEFGNLRKEYRKLEVGPAGIEPATNRLIVLRFISPPPYAIFVTFIVAHFWII